MKKLLSQLFIAFSIALLLPSCGESKVEREYRLKQVQKDSSYGTREVTDVSSRKMEKAEEYSSEQAQETSLYGTWEVIDALDRKWEIVINGDKTVRINHDGKTIAYGSWKFSNYDTQILLEMTKDPRITFPDLSEGFMGYGSIYEGFLYYSTRSARSKDPTLRLPIKKIK